MAVVKYAALVLLVLQTSCMVITLRYTRTVKTDQPRYLSSTVVFLAEFLKAVSCLCILFYEAKFEYKQFVNNLYRGMLGQPKETVKIAVPSGVYSLQNNLLFIALSYLDAGTYQVTYQLKILTTAIFSVFLLKRVLSIQQWIALFLLTIGVALVQLPAESETTTNLTVGNRLFGLLVLLVACASSGFAGVYFELLLKKSTISLWMRNLQMALFGTLFSAITIFFNDSDKISKHGFFQGYSAAVLFVLILQTYGGLLVAFVIQYTDNIIKGFATSISIIVSSLVSYLILDDLQLTGTFLVGTVIVLCATYMYGRQASSKKAK